DFLDHAGRHRPLYRVSAEWLTTTYPALELTSWAGDAVRHRRLASCDPHGGWIEWLDEAGYRPRGGPPARPPTRRDQKRKDRRPTTWWVSNLVSTLAVNPGTRSK